MVKSVWTTPETIKAKNEGFEAALRRQPRAPKTPYTTYNERAAFNDGWDEHTESLRRVRSAMSFSRTMASRQRRTSES